MQHIQLENDVVLLRPFELNDVEQALQAANDPAIWSFLSTDLSIKENMQHFIEDAILNYSKNDYYRFAVVDKATGKIVGSTSLMDISLLHKRVEIGWTWYNPSVWRTAINTNCKLLLLQYCFEQWDMMRVQIKTDHENVRSQQAIERLGAIKEGILRNHMIRKDGSQRHTVMYSLTNEDWSATKQHLLNLSNKFGQ